MAKFADKRICSVGYLSKKLNGHFSQTKAGIDNLLQTVKSLLPSLPVPDKLREEIAKDAGRGGRGPQDAHSRGRRLVVDRLSHRQRRWKSYDYDWSEHPELDSSKPLDLLKHVGGNPIAVLVGRSKVSPDGYDLLVKWIGHRLSLCRGVRPAANETRRSAPSSTRSLPR